jgi:hypothetical protein
MKGGFFMALKTVPAIIAGASGKLGGRTEE